jgi:hypothetical protein
LYNNTNASSFAKSTKISFKNVQEIELLPQIELLYELLCFVLCMLAHINKVQGWILDIYFQDTSVTISRLFIYIFHNLFSNNVLLQDTFQYSDHLV